MGHLFPLKTKILSILAALMMLTLCGALVMVWYTYRIEDLLETVVKKDIAAYRAVEGLETALVNQKGFVSYFFIDKDPDWLRQLNLYRHLFKERLAEAYHLGDESAGTLETLNEIDIAYGRYVQLKDQVISHYTAGRKTEGIILHREVRDAFFAILDRCEALKRLQTERIVAARRQLHRQAGTLRITAAGAVALGVLLAGGLIVLLTRQVLGPVRRMALEANPAGSALDLGNDIAALNRGVHHLLTEVDHTRSQLQKSRESLVQSEKLALVGKLAAGMAHSIRNPFTSVKMRLFSLSRALRLTETQKEDLSVISQEIRHIDHIVQNFLEFARPPRLQFQAVSPSVVVDQACQLLSHRLKSYAVTVDITRACPLPEVNADPEQLKEVIVNLMVNACEAMPGGGRITIAEYFRNNAAVITVADQGSGISASVLNKIFQPFFTTKEDGTGLGLSIAQRIVEEHHGHIAAAVGKGGAGTVFTVTLPVREVSA